MHLRALLPFTAAVCVSAQIAFAADLAMPDGPVVLTVSGQISQTNAADQAQFDRAMLAALPVTTYETTTIWTEGDQSFTGVSLHDLAALLDMEGTTLLASAVNDYQVKIPLSDALPGGPIVAYLHNGTEMSVRTKGPLWIIYPYDDVAEYRSETIYSRSIWQLNRIEVVE